MSWLSTLSKARTRASNSLHGREALAGWPAGVIAAGTCLALLVVLFFADIHAPQGVTFGSLGLIPVLAASLVLSRRLTALVVLAAVLLRAMSTGLGGVQPLTAMSQAVSYVFVAWIAFIAADALRASRRNAAQAGRLRTVIEAAAKLAAVSLSPIDLVEQLMVHSVRTAGADRGSVSRIESDEMVVEASYDSSGESLQVGSRWKIASQPLVVEVMEGKRAIQGTSVEVDELAPELSRKMAELQHILAVPLLLEGSVQGLLTLSRFREPAFSNDEIESVEQASRIASLALRGSRLHADAELARTGAETAAYQLRESERQLAEAQEIAQLGSWEWDMPRNQLTWSEELYRIYGRSPADGALTYEDFLSAVHPDDRDFVRGVIEDAFATGRPYSFDHRIVRPDGMVRTLHALGRVVIDESQRPVLMTGTGQDITERRQAEQDLLALTREREDQLVEHTQRMMALEKLKGEFLLLASHELRGPLTVINGYLSLMQDGVLGELPERTRDVLPTMAAKAAAMNHLIDEMLQTARLEQGFQLQLKPLDLRELALEAVGSVAPLVGAEQRLVTASTAKAIPILGDRERLIIILTSLLDNAIKYSGPQGEIAYSVSVEEGWATVAVQDRGLGISREGMAKLFTRFGRIITAENAHIPGTGLGLYLAQGLADMHGGRITVESELGQGSTFTLRLPIASAPQSPRRPAQSHRSPGSIRRSRASIKDKPRVDR